MYENKKTENEKKVVKLLYNFHSYAGQPVGRPTSSFFFPIHSFAMCRAFPAPPLVSPHAAVVLHVADLPLVTLGHSMARYNLLGNYQRKRAPRDVHSVAGQARNFLP